MVEAEEFVNVACGGFAGSDCPDYRRGATLAITSAEHAAHALDLAERAGHDLAPFDRQLVCAEFGRADCLADGHELAAACPP